MMTKLLAVFVSIFLIGIELPVAHGRDADKRMVERSEAQAQSERREQQRVTKFKNEIKARKLRIKERRASLEALVKAAVAACDRAGFEAAMTQFEKYARRESDWAYYRDRFHGSQAEKYKKKLSAANKKIDRLRREKSDAYTVFTRDTLSGQIETQNRNSTDLTYKIAALSEIIDSAISYGSFVDKLLYTFKWVKYPKDCTKETVSQAGQNNDRQAAVDDELKRAGIIEKEAPKPEERVAALQQGGGETSKPEAGQGRIVEAAEGGMLTGKTVTLADLEGCGGIYFFDLDDKYSMRMAAKELFGFVSTPCPGLTGGRIVTQADYTTHCQIYKEPRDEGMWAVRHPNGLLPICSSFPGPYPPEYNQTGLRGTPAGAFCSMLQYGLLASRDTDLIKKAILEGVSSAFKYDRKSRRLECFYLSKAQRKSLSQQYKKLKKDSPPAKPVAEGNPPDSASSTDANTETTTTSVRNPDGTRTVTKTDRNGKVLSKETVGKSPASASSTDRKTGVTTKSVRNPDGTRTVTKTDKDGNLLSKETVGNSPDSASATDPKTGVTIKSVANPDGSRTVTTTDKDGIVLSREKVR